MVEADDRNARLPGGPEPITGIQTTGNVAGRRARPGAIGSSHGHHSGAFGRRGRVPRGGVADLLSANGRASWGTVGTGCEWPLGAGHRLRARHGKTGGTG